MGDVSFDLLGDPIPEGFGKRGRPPHVVTDEKRNIVMQLLAFGRPVEYISAALAISPPTLRKNYFRELRAREEARARVDAKLLSALMAEAEAGNVSAIEKYFKRLDRHDMALLAARMQSGQPSEKTEQPGKKEARKKAAQEISGVFAVPAGPGRPN